MVSKQTILTFFDAIDDVQRELSNKEVLIFLDYDGTLTPIVDTPDLAILSKDVHDCLKELAEKYTVSIVSGRATDDVRSKVNIQNIFYAGSHGFEIIRPDGEAVIHPQAQAMRFLIEEVYDELKEQTKDIKGALIEDVKYTVSVHYRLVAEEDFPKMEEATKNILDKYPQLLKTDGKKVFELRPNIDWHKGKAVQWILDFMQFQPDRNRVLYIGDDRTDEDAFEVITDKGIGILVAEELRESQAHYYVSNVEEVKKVLEFFNSLKS